MTGGRNGAAAGDASKRPAPFEQLIPTRIHKVSDALEDVARLMLDEAHGLGFTETRILAHLEANRSASVIDISRDLRVDKAWISRRVQSLVTDGLIRKDRDVSDSRIIIVSLTEKGRSLAGRALAVAEEAYSNIMDGVDEELAKELIGRLEINVKAILSRLRSGQRSASVSRGAMA